MKHVVTDQIAIASTAHAHAIAAPTPGAREVARETAEPEPAQLSVRLQQLSVVRSHGPDPDGQMLEHLKLFSDAHDP